MSFGDFLLVALLLAPFAACAIGLVVFSVLCIISDLSKPESRRDLLVALLAMSILGYLAWLVMGFPGLHEPKKPHAVEGREEWIDQREGTHYSQTEKRNDV